MRWLVPILLLAFVAAAAAATERPPWQRRIGRDVDVRHKAARQTLRPDLWPPEPASPEPVDRARFEAALTALCGKMPPDRPGRFAAAVLAEAERFGVDPFLMAALMYDQSSCLPRTPDSDPRSGLTRIDIGMHAPHVRGGKYRYFLREEGGWRLHALDVSAFPFNKWKAEKAEPAFYFTAAILSVLAEQCPDLDAAFGGAPHRHAVSHWFWGDKVDETEPEDRVLTARRRLLAYYHDTVPAAVGTFRGVPISSPLDGVPRLVLDYFGNPRGEKGTPGHRGLDLDGAVGEPVRAVAAGRVTFAGLDLPGGARSEQATPEEAEARRGRPLGPGGLWVSVNHGNDFGSLYMHLDTLAVRTGDAVPAGGVIGTLGRSGTVVAGPHLHLELRVGTSRVDPAEVLADVLVNPFARAAR